MRTRSISRNLVLFAAMASVRSAAADGPRDALVQAPTFKQPERGSLSGSLAKFSIGAEDVSRGSYALALPIAVPSERGELLAEVLPSYAPENGISEWGIGWSAGLAIQRFRLVGDVDYQTDEFTSPWGRLVMGTDGLYYVAGVKVPVRIERRSDGWIATDSSGTRSEFRHAVTTPEGVYAWYLTRVETVFGDAAAVEYATGPGGRPFVSRVLYGGREDPATYRLDLEYETLPVALVDFRSGYPLALDRRVIGVVASAKTGGRGPYGPRWRYDITYRENGFGPGFHLDSLLRRFASGESEPPISYDYDLQEQATPVGTAFESGELDGAPGLGDYLAATDDPDGVQPDHAAAVDADEDGRPDLEHGSDFTLFRQSATGAFVADALPPPPPGVDPFCRPPDASFNRARSLVRMAGPGTDLQVLVLEALSATTEIRVCDRTGVPRFGAQVPGLWNLGSNMKVVDLNRDDRPDLLLVDSGTYEVLENTSGDGCAPGSVGPCVPFGFRHHPPVELAYLNGFPFTPSATWSHDMNGDGNPDLLQRTDDRISIWYGRGRFRFEEMERQLAFLNRDGDELFNLDDWEIAWVDANKDGLTDALMSIGQESALFIDEGDHFREVVVPALEDANLLGLGTPVVGDFRARGDLDLNFVAAEASAIGLTMPSTGLLVAADDGKGTLLTFDYERAPGAPGLRQRPSVLRSLTVASAGGDPTTHEYTYAAPRIHTVGHFLIGFGTVEATAPKTRTVVAFHHDDDIAGLVETSSAFDDDTPGLMKFSRTLHEEATVAGVRIRRDRTRWSGWCSGADVSACLAGTASAAIEVVDTTAYQRGICPTSVRRTDRHGQLVTDTALAAPSGLAGALHCVPGGQVWTGTHAAPARDFRLENRLTLDDRGQLLRVEQLGAGSWLTLQEVSYDPASSRLASVSIPGQGVQLFSYDPDTGQLDSTTAADGVVASVPDRDPLTDAMRELVRDRGPGGVLVSSFRHDGMERLARRWSDFGGSSAERPLESVAYQFPTADFPGLVQVDKLVAATTGARERTASWTYPDGTELARATQIQGGWVFDGVSAIDRNELRTRSHRRAPLPDAADIAMQSYGSILAETVQLAEKVAAGFGHEVGTRIAVQQGVERRTATTLSIADGLLIAVVRENDALETRSATDARGLRISTADELGNVTRHEYDALGRLVAALLPDGARQELSFDPFGRPAAVSRSGVGTVTYTYEPVTGRLLHKDYRDTAGGLERRVRFEYDAIGRVVERVHTHPASGDERRFRFRHDGDAGGGEVLAGQRGYTTQVEGPAYTATTVHNPDGTEASSTIDLAGWMQIDTSSTYHAGGDPDETHRVITRLSDGAVIDEVAVRHVYDAWGRLERIAVDGQTLATLHYDDDDRVTRVDIAGGQRIDPIYDAVTHRQSGYSQTMRRGAGAWQTGVEWEFDDRGLIAREAIGLADQTWLRSYTYDPRGFLVGAEDADQQSDYGYGASGRRLPTEPQGDNVDGVGGHRATVAGFPYTYDSSGRVIGRGDAVFTYGPDGHLAVAHIGARTLTYDYDAGGNRLLKYEDGLPVAAFVAGGYLTEDRFTGPLEIGGRVVGILENGDFHLLATDGRGTLLADRDGTPRLANPYGVRATRPDLSAAIDYVEKGYDPDLHSIRMGVRDFDPVLGQFWSPDPLYLEAIDKCAESPVDCNLYSYARNNPVSFVDPTGTEPEAKKETDPKGAGPTAPSNSVKPIPTIYLLEGGPDDPLWSPFRGRVLDSPLREAGKQGYMVKRIQNATVWDLRAAISDPAAIGVITVSHGAGGELIFSRRQSDLPKDLPADDLLRKKDLVGPGAVGPKWVTPSPNLKFVLLLACEAMQRRNDWQKAIGGASLHGYDYNVTNLRVWYDSPLKDILENHGIRATPEPYSRFEGARPFE